jgi:hypothetical protein
VGAIPPGAMIVVDQESRHPFAFRHLCYEGAGHLIFVPYPPTTVRVSGLVVEGLQDSRLHMGGTASADVEAGIDAWRKNLQFLEDAVQSHG